MYFMELPRGASCPLNFDLMIFVARQNNYRYNFDGYHCWRLFLVLVLVLSAIILTFNIILLLSAHCLYLYLSISASYSSI